jgi:lipid-A-disaccharide synthase-like uncharacterized protein
MTTGETVWLTIGFVGQLLFTARFLVQWLASERRRDSVVPVAFWYFSLAGGLTLFTYATYKRDPVFMLGQGMGLVVYIRNLMLLRQAQRRAEKQARRQAASVANATATATATASAASPVAGPHARIDARPSSSRGSTSSR